MVPVTVLHHFDTFDAIGLAVALHSTTAPTSRPCPQLSVQETVVQQQLFTHVVVGQPS
jgi:hypothetical protein